MWSYLLLATALAAAPPGEDAVLDVVYAEAWVAADTPAELAEIRALGAGLAEGRRAAGPGRVEHRILADADTLAALADHGFDVRITRQDHRLGAPPDGYHTPEQGWRVLEDIAASTSRAGIVHLGTSVEGRALVALWLGQPPDSLRARTLRVLGAHHGDELSSAEVALDTASTLAELDGDDPAITSLLDEATVWIAPWINPDGVLLGSRFNANRVDLNRNYDFMWSEDELGAGEHPFSEPETRAVRTLAWLEPPSLSLSMHSGEVNIGWVWNHTTTDSPEEAVLAEIGETYASTCTTPEFWATNGAEWYPSHGDTNDWSYGRYGGMDYTLEVTRRKTPEALEIPEFQAHHREAVLQFLTRPPTLSGRVVDADTGRPVVARLVLSRGGAPILFTADPVGGRFARHATPGEAWLVVDAPGYAPWGQTVAVGPGLPPLEISLEPDGRRGGRPEPARVSARSWVALPGAPEAETVTLRREGLPWVTLPLVDGAVEVDPEALAPGPWTLWFSDGTAWPHALFVADTGTRIHAAEVVEDLLVVTGEGFAPGSRALGLWGADRALVPLPVVSEGQGEITVDLSPLPSQRTADVLLVSNGSQQAILDVTGDLDVDTAAPMDTGLDDTGFRLVQVGCGCHSPGTSALLWAPLALLALRRRRFP